jgi:hypothetical protein
MSTLCTGFERWGMRLRGNERFRGPNGDQHGLRSQELDEGPSDLTAWPIAPAHRLSRNRRGGWYLFSRRRCLARLGDRCSTCWRGGHRRCGARPEHGTHPSRLERRARFLTLFAQRTGAAMANAGGIQHAASEPLRSGLRSCTKSGWPAGQRSVPSGCRVNTEPENPCVKEGRAQFGGP